LRGGGNIELWEITPQYKEGLGVGGLYTLLLLASLFTQTLCEKLIRDLEKY